MKKIVIALLLFVFSWSFATDYSVQFEEAQAKFNSAYQTESIPMFEKLLLNLETKAKQEGLDEKEIGFLTRSYDMLGQAQFNNNDQSSAKTAFLKLLEWNPDYQMDEELVSKKIVDLLNIVKRDNLAMLTILSTPPGASVFLDGRNFGSTNIENQYILKGKHKLELRLPGYQSEVREIEIPANSMKEITVQFAEDPGL